MTIKPLDIRRKEFKNSLRGYDQNQVDDFLDSIADEFEKVFSENQRMKDQVSTLRERLEQFDDLEGSIRAALVHAEQSASNLRQSSARDAENVRRNAEREAELTIREAKSSADQTMREAKARGHQILADSSSRVERVQESYEALREARGTFAADFRHLLSTYMSVMENMDVATAKEIETSLRDRLDPESIAVAREAAASEGETRIQPPLSTAELTDQEPEIAETSTPEDTASEEDAPAFESSRDPAESAEYDPTQDPNATQRMMAPSPEQSEPEVEEPEVEPSSVSESASDEAGPSETAEPEREEPAAFHSSGSERRDEDDTEERTLASEPASEGFFEERQETNERSWRAGRFLRRRG